jgi:ubiquinone/menaquinone biosynthesis C-methylase UbiE
MKTDTSKFSATMREDWDTRARKNAFYYIASWRQDWNEATFFQSGEDDYEKFVAGILNRHAIPASSMMLELGCGAGRMTRSFAQRFTRVTAIDISAEMLKHARTLHADIKNINWIQGNGLDLAGISNGSVDFVFSYLVLQHLPNEDLVRSYIGEMLRVLKVGGICLFQFNGTADRNMNWKGRVAWSLMDSLWELRLRRASRSAAKLLGFDPEMVGKTWHGTDVKSAQIADVVRQNRGTVLELLGAKTPMAWCCARKSLRVDKTHST